MNAVPAVNPDIKPGIYQGIPNESYHAGPGISKSGLWTIHTKSPAHFKYGEAEKKNHLDLGDATHIAILEPNTFEGRVVRGPDDRRGNKWKDQLEICNAEGRVLLTSADYDSVLTIRDVVHADQWLNTIITGGKPQVEASGYWIDEKTGELCRCRPDLYREDLGIILDIKTSVSTHPDAFPKAVDKYGYHGQEAFYSDGWRSLGKPVEGWAFLAIEKFAQGVPFRPPYAFAVYELPPSIVEEGRAVVRQSLDTYHECRKSDQWPGYGSGVQELSFKRWSYRLTEAPDALDEQEAA